MAKPKNFPPYPANPLKHGGGAKLKIDQKSYYLGKHGSERSYREYERLRSEFAVNGTIAIGMRSTEMTVDEVIAAWLEADPRGLRHAEVRRVARACVPLSRLFGSTLAADFKATRLRALQEAMIDQRWMTNDEKKECGRWSRRYLNKSIERVVRVFAWAESTERLPLGTMMHLRTVPDLKVTDRRVHDNPEREPVDWTSQVEPCFPHLAPVVCAILTVLYRGGMRPGEVCKMRRCEIDQSAVAGVWLYKPTSHKNQWRGHELTKVLGPVCQKTLAPWLMACEPDDFIFPPVKQRLGAKHYTPNGVGQAVRKAIVKAGVKPWCLYSLRHSAARTAEASGGLAAAGAMLGHRSLETTLEYVDRQRLGLAIETARKIG